MKTAPKKRWLILATGTTREMFVYADNHDTAILRACMPGQPFAAMAGWQYVIGYTFVEACAKRDAGGSKRLFVVPAGEFAKGKLVSDLPVSMQDGRKAPGA